MRVVSTRDEFNFTRCHTALSIHIGRVIDKVPEDVWLRVFSMHNLCLAVQLGYPSIGLSYAS